jgi:hypothetical protein
VRASHVPSVTLMNIKSTVFMHIYFKNSKAHASFRLSPWFATLDPISLLAVRTLFVSVLG